MSEENVEMVRETLKSFERGEIDASWAKNARLSAPEGWPDQGPFVGREAIRRQFERLASDWSRHVLSDVEIVSAKGDWVVIAFRWETQGAASGLETTFDVAAAYRIEDRAFAEAHFRWNREDALEAAGLSE
ncbi:MAG: nuclear transport factor 2 family protein [Solirubrobacterales bacterium]